MLSLEKIFISMTSQIRGETKLYFPPWFSVSIDFSATVVIKIWMFAIRPFYRKRKLIPALWRNFCVNIMFLCVCFFGSAASGGSPHLWRSTTVSDRRRGEGQLYVRKIQACGSAGVVHQRRAGGKNTNNPLQYP